MKVPFYRHNAGAQEAAALRKVLGTLFLTTGPATAEFERRFAAYLRCGHAVGVSSWTMGGLITLEALGVGPGDEVITSPLTFIASSNIVLNLGAKPVFVDVEPETGNLRADLIERAITPRTKAILPVHLYGQMCDMKAIRAIADKHKLAVVEDAAHCVEGVRDGVRPGQLSDAAVFSFYATKNITCGEGGAIVTNRPELAEKLKLLRSHGMSKSAADRYVGTYQHWDMEVLGHKCNMSDIQAAMLLPQLKKIDAALQVREKLCRRYEAAFSKMDEIGFPKALPGGRHARHLFTLWAPEGKRDRMLKGLQDRGVGVAVNFRAVHLLSYYRRTLGFKPGMFPAAEKIGDATLTLPLYPKLPPKAVDYVIASVKDLCREL